MLFPDYLTEIAEEEPMSNKGSDRSQGQDENETMDSDGETCDKSGENR